MNCLDELENYCGEKNPAGAMLLTGEWGCGKTYFVEHELKTALQHSYILVRISLFGMTSADELHATVKRKWIEAVIQEKGFSAQSIEVGEKAAKVVTEVSTNLSCIMPESIKNLGSLLSVNIMDCISVKNEIGDKTVVLIFDDLERSKLSEIECFGCINEYCENQNFNTIIIANEDMIKEEAGVKHTYKEIKEKLIQRTVKFEVDYKRVIAGVLAENNWSNTRYAQFLGENVKMITSIFSGIGTDGRSLNEKANNSCKKNNYSKEHREEERRIITLQKKRPHNIRSLKCVLQDFERVYILLEEKQIKNKDRWLASYIAYVFAYRAGLISEETEYGNLFSQDNLAILYPGYYNSKYMISGIIDWIKSGRWNQKRLNMELDDVIERDKAKKPEDIVRTNSIVDLEDDIIINGFTEVRSLAYEGHMSFSEYVLLIENACWARKYNISIPEVDWNKIQTTIKQKISKAQENDNIQGKLRRRISIDQRSNFTDKEWETYKIIESAFEEEQFVYARNQNQYIKLMKESSGAAFEYAKRHRFDVFNLSMSEVTATAFERESNADKHYFPMYFEGVWKEYKSMQGIKLEETEDGFNNLQDRLKTLLNKYKNGGKQIAAVHTEKFIGIVQKMLDTSIQSQDY